VSFRYPRFSAPSAFAPGRKVGKHLATARGESFRESIRFDSPVVWPTLPAQLSILVVLLSCDAYPQVASASMCCGRVVRRNHAEPCLRAVVRDHRHALLPLRNCRHFVDSRWNRALRTSFVAILPSSPSSRSARSIGPQRQRSVGRRLALMSFCSRDYLR
jgi:hypothetical protein